MLREGRSSKGWRPKKLEGPEGAAGAEGAEEKDALFAKPVKEGGCTFGTKKVKVQACRVAAQAIQVEYAEDAAVR